MNGLGPFGTGGYALNRFASPLTSRPKKGEGGLSIATGAVRPSTPDGGAAASAARTGVMGAAATMRVALGGLAFGSRPVFTPTVSVTPAAAAQAAGRAARLIPVQTGVAALYATQPIYTHYDTTRLSTDPIGLDQSSSASRLLSAALGLDVTTPAAASRLTSAALGLDLTSPPAASVLTSSAALGLDVSTPDRASTIQSTAEINGATTSYGSPTLLLTGSGQPSTSIASLEGVYTGTGAAAGASSLTLQINRNATLNAVVASNVRFEVRDQNNTLLFSFNGNLKAGEQVYLGDAIGLTVAFSTGSVTNNHTASTTVSHTNTDVNPNAAFNASANARPRFENGAQVTAGSFTVNGVAIAVNASDTINTVLARINASNAGVTASFANDRVTLTSTAASEDAIVLGGDTSGFLSAVKLSGATTARGSIRDDRQALAGTARYGGVVGGSFRINGVAIAVDPTRDTLDDVVARINAAGAGVTATYDAATDRFVLTGTEASQDLIRVDGDDTGFLAAAALHTANTVRGHLPEDGVALANVSRFQSVQDGSFEIDGRTIAVDVNADSVNAIVAKINASGARVVASYDAGADRLVLQATYDSEDAVPLGADSSGFLAAAGLDAANTVRGNLRDDLQALATTARFGSVASGSFRVNGRTIAVDAARDTLQDVMARINAADAGVTATFDLASGRIELVADEAGDAAIVVDQDSTGLVEAAGLDSTQTVLGKRPDDERVLATTGRFQAVTDGAFRVNGVAIDVRAGIDTLQSVIARINGSGAGVVAWYDGQDDRLVVQSTGAGLLAIEDDTSGLLAAARLAEGVTGTRLNPDAPFDATGPGRSLLDPGLSVQAGSFTVNGVTIQVEADDSVSSVLARITASDARVTATFDAGTETVTLVSRDPGAAAISLGSDTSGFLAAVKLDATAVAGVETRPIAAFDLALGRMAEYAGVRAGVLTVNGHTLAIDPAQTTIRGLVAALGDIDGIVATADERTGQVRVAAREIGSVLELTDTSGLLPTLGLAPGTYRHVDEVVTTTQVHTASAPLSNAGQVARQLAAAAFDLNAALEALVGIWRDGASESGEIEEALRDIVSSLERAGIEGLGVQAGGDHPRLVVDPERVAQAVERLGPSAGLVPTLTEALDAFAGRVGRGLEPGEPPAAAGTGVALGQSGRVRASEDGSGLVLSALSLQPSGADAAGRPEAVPVAAPQAQDHDGGLPRRLNPFVVPEFEAPLGRASKLGIWEPPGEKPSKVATPKASFGPLPNEWPPVSPDPLQADPLEPALPREADPDPDPESASRVDDMAAHRPAQGDAKSVTVGPGVQPGGPA